MDKGIFTCDSKNARIDVFDTNFTQNSAFEGAILNGIFESSANFNNCNFIENFALKASIGTFMNHAKF